MSNVGRGQSVATKPRFPWIVLLLLAATIYAFWILPAQMGPRKIKIEFEPVQSSS